MEKSANGMSLHNRKVSRSFLCFNCANMFPAKLHEILHLKSNNIASWVPTNIDVFIGVTGSDAL